MIKPTEILAQAVALSPRIIALLAHANQASVVYSRPIDKSMVVIYAAEVTQQ